MAIYTFAFTHRLDNPPPLPPGIQHTVEIFDVGDLAAVVEHDISIEQLQIDDQKLMQAVLIHDQVIRSIFESTVVLPLRFGTCFVNSDRLLEHLTARAPSYLKALEDLAGKAEYTLKATPTALPNSVDASQVRGRDYLVQKKKQYQVKSDYLHKQQDEFNALLKEIEDQYPHTVIKNSDTELRKISLLCDRRQETAVLNQLHSWQLQYPKWDLQLSEALPPYHFASL